MKHTGTSPSIAVCHNGMVIGQGGVCKGGGEVKVHVQVVTMRDEVPILVCTAVLFGWMLGLAGAHLQPAAGCVPLTPVVRPPQLSAGAEPSRNWPGTYTPSKRVVRVPAAPVAGGWRS